jgi:hypothetical protein
VGHDSDVPDAIERGLRVSRRHLSPYHR